MNLTDLSSDTVFPIGNSFFDSDLISLGTLGTLGTMDASLTSQILSMLDYRHNNPFNPFHTMPSPADPTSALVPSSRPPSTPNKVLINLNRDILVLICDHLSNSDLLSLATTNKSLTSFFIHLLRNRDGALGLSSASLARARSDRSLSDLTTALAYNIIPTRTLTASLNVVAPAVAGDFSWVERLLYEGVSPNTCDPDGETPLCAILRSAISAGGYGCVVSMARLLLRHGAWADMRGATTVGPSDCYWWGPISSPLELLLMAGAEACVAHEGNSCVLDLVKMMVRTEGFSLRGMNVQTLKELVARVEGEEERGVIEEVLMGVGA
ncbi:hypothetical protein QBC34DRAFT_212191 [Podospora aff. communis PSN243]|uniref:F-box domain-containing protein n=1 Tax=Podospora aff. communis PSN243 TaxID=3040156 RepID=A0AAV9G8B8_9PEZI|nr:hypothetical protein QBC34DRAFT_212191 [Podospora aff. communis PSN243]